MTDPRSERSRVERPIEELPSALDRWDEIEQAIGSRRPVLFCDFDGTLAPIVLDPDDAAPPDELRERLRRVSREHPLAVISGRDLGDLRRRVGIDSAYYAGSHGFEFAGPGFSTEHELGREFLAPLDRAERALIEETASIPGARVERKRFAIAVHFRGAPEGAAAAVERAVRELGESRRGLRTTSGRKVIELRPDVPWDKGRAVEWLLPRMVRSEASPFPLFLGDDVTDEDGFRAVEATGLGIVVRGRRGTTRARYALAGPDEVLELLERLYGEPSVGSGRRADPS